MNRYILLLLTACITTTLKAQSFQESPLVQNFASPPESAKPRVWWHWMNANISKEGITKDLEWMKRVGIGGMQLFEANLVTPRVVANPILYNTPEWKDAITHTANEATRLGLEWTLSASGGWSQTGGPMVLPEEAMKKIVWSETYVTGGKNFQGTLTNPPSVSGTFQDATKKGPTFYKEISVVAYRLPDNEIRLKDVQPKVSASSEIDLALLTDSQFNKSTKLKIEKGTDAAWVIFDFQKQVTASAVTLALGNLPTAYFQYPATGRIMASDDGINYITLTTFPGAAHRPALSRTYGFKETSARYFKIELTPIEINSYDNNGALAKLLGPKSVPQDYTLFEIEFHNASMVNLWQEKAAFGALFEYNNVPTNEPKSVTPVTDVIDLTSKVTSTGQLNWDAPKGRWVVLRMGYSLTGQTNGPAPRELTGLEADKLSKKYMTSYLDKYLKPYFDQIGDQYGQKGLQYLLVDSWEANFQNWTDEMIPEFKKRNGYDPTPYLPVLTGRVIGSADISDRFLWDFRNTISDLLIDYHYQTIADYLHAKGLKLYGEAIGTSMDMIADGLKAKGRVDIPMGEFWTASDIKSIRSEYLADILEAASAGHIYDKNIIASESFTDLTNPWGPPSKLKYMADFFMTKGVNRFIFHTSVHQPTEQKPGMTMMGVGQHYTRHNTWAEQSIAWNTYLSRCSYLLQQGSPTSDVAYFYGEGAPVVSPWWEKISPAIPEGYKYDLINKEVIIDKLEVKDGVLTLPHGVTYKVLVLPDFLDKMSLPLLQKIKKLVADGATIIAPKPHASPSLIDYVSADKEIQKIADEVWGVTNGHTITKNNFGKGKMYWGASVSDVLSEAQVEEDFTYSKPHINTTLHFIHRHTSTEEIYFVANEKDQEENSTLRFRTGGMVPHLMNPDNAMVEPLTYTIENGITTVNIKFDPMGSAFIVFSGKATQLSNVVPTGTAVVLQELNTSWTVQFPNLYNNTPEVKMDKLISWTTSADSTIRYYSGTAKYNTSFIIKKNPTGERISIDLGDVREIAEIKINGRPAGIAWKKPFRIDVTDLLKAGKNEVEVSVTNLWTNRLEGDKKLPKEKRFTFSTIMQIGPPSAGELIPSGLLGPVRIVKE